MIPITVFAGKQVAVFGLGHSGLLAARALTDGGAEVVVFDDEPKKVEEARAAGLATQDLRALDWGKLAALVLAPGVPLTHPTPHWSAALARAAKVEIIGDIELFCRERAKSGAQCPLIAITGTNGKSTTTALTAHLIRHAGRDAQMGGNIGVPVLALEPFAQNGEHARVYVLEVSSYQIDLAPSLKPTVGILLNVTEDHLDRHGSMENYAAIKALPVASVEPGGSAVIGVDDRYTRDAAERIERAGKTVVRVSVTAPLRDGYYAEGSRIMRSVAGKAHPVAQLAGIGSLRGQHNAQNAASALAACVALGIDLPTIQKGLLSFPGLAHRMQQVGRKPTNLGNILYVNDSKATNADSAAKALASFHDIFWIAGGRPKTGGIVSLEEFFPRIRKAYLIGEAAKEFAKTLEGKVPYEIAHVLSAAIDAATRDAQGAGLKEPVVLLSPACASFDQYPNFEVRGKAFSDLVLAIPGVSSPSPSRGG
ncbi:MAG TPA: UDP-N-acetylmuramoyl-L-alanine--D-glutamate ligase [Pseudolabrys sp.]|nr:UDP-N-acetylmuramoyl-L-alanine--D-glutamate ligase [Pseudolabrys sp.]